MVRGWGRALAALALVVLAVGCTTDEDGSRDVTATPSPTGTPTQTAIATLAPTRGAVFYDFDPVSVRDQAADSLNRISVYFVDDRPGAHYYDLAQQCAQREVGVGGRDRAWCYAFSSGADYDHANVDAAAGGMTLVCYRAYADLTAGATSYEGTEDNDEIHDAIGCPGP